MLQQQAQSPINELMQAKILRATLSERQLEEVLVDFWFNHFNVFLGKGQVRQYLTEYERDAIRPNVLGNFRDDAGRDRAQPGDAVLSGQFPEPHAERARAAAARAGNSRICSSASTIRDLTPAQRQQIMQRGSDADRSAAQRPQGGLNENYARELMELHTLGVDGGYTQQDVIEVASILTGWTIDRPQQGGGFVFRPQMHDSGKQDRAGQEVQVEDGENEGEQLLDMLATHPSTAQHISFKLAQRFVADEPPAALVDRAAKKFLETKGDLREVTRVDHHVAGVLRRAVLLGQGEDAARIRRLGGARDQREHRRTRSRWCRRCSELGMPLYGAQPPTGYSMTADAWVNTGALLNRMNFARAVAERRHAAADGRPRARTWPAPARIAQPRAADSGPGPGPRRAADAAADAATGAATGRGPIQVDVRALAPDTSEASVEQVIEHDARRPGVGRARARPSAARQRRSSCWR